MIVIVPARHAEVNARRPTGMCAGRDIGHILFWRTT
jgi:hypothetical protein